MLPLDCALYFILVLFYQIADVLYWLQAYVYIWQKNTVCLIIKKHKKDKKFEKMQKKEKESIVGKSVIYILKLHAQGWESHI